MKINEISSVSAIWQKQSPKSTKFTPSFISVEQNLNETKNISRVSNSVDRLYGDAFRRLAAKMRVEKEKNKIESLDFSDKKVKKYISTSKINSRMASPIKNVKMWSKSSKKIVNNYIKKAEKCNKTNVRKLSNNEIEIKKILQRYEINEVLNALNSILKENSDETEIINISPKYLKRSPNIKFTKRVSGKSNFSNVFQNSKSPEYDFIPTIEINKSPSKSQNLEKYISQKSPAQKFSQKSISPFRPNPRQGDID